MKAIFNGLAPFMWGVFVIASHVAYAAECDTQRLRIEKLSVTVSKLEVTQQKLNSSFSKTVERDLANQVEGLIDEIQRAKAFKVAFARKKIGRRIDSLKSEYASLRKNYCRVCSDTPGDNAKNLCTISKE